MQASLCDNRQAKPSIHKAVAAIVEGPSPSLPLPSGSSVGGRRGDDNGGLTHPSRFELDPPPYGHGAPPPHIAAPLERSLQACRLGPDNLLALYLIAGTA